MKQKVNDELKQHFRPEFLNRIDDIIVFHQLTEDEIVEIVDLMIGPARRADAQQGHGSGAHRRRRRRCWPRRATTRCSVPGRCAARSSARSRTRCREQILFGELDAGPDRGRRHRARGCRWRRTARRSSPSAARPRPTCSSRLLRLGRRSLPSRWTAPERGRFLGAVRLDPLGRAPFRALPLHGVWIRARGVAELGQRHDQGTVG